MKKIRVRITVDRIQSSVFLDLHRMLTSLDYNPEIVSGETNEIVLVWEGRFGQDDGEGYFMETGSALGLVRGFLSGKGHRIDSHSVERFN